MNDFSKMMAAKYVHHNGTKTFISSNEKLILAYITQKITKFISPVITGVDIENATAIPQGTAYKAVSNLRKYGILEAERVQHAGRGNPLSFTRFTLETVKLEDAQGNMIHVNGFTFDELTRCGIE